MDKSFYTKRLDSVIQRIEDARRTISEHHIVKLVAVSKYSEVPEVKGLYEAGQRAYGENKVQDLKAKSEALDELPLAWHFLGRLQKNKINQLIEAGPTLFQSLDSYELAVALNQRLVAKETTMNALLQINSSGESSKQGIDPENAIELYKKIKNEMPNIKLQGVMTIGAHSEDEQEIKKSFDTTYKIFENLKENGAKICSMGMSSDFELAIKCGSNMVRLGSVLFK